MNPEFWHKRWQKNEIGFHEASGNSLLKQFFKKWALPHSPRVFIPLCGKTKDIGWLLSNGVEVVAVELNQQAIEMLFEELDVQPVITQQKHLRCYQAPSLKVYVGDFFSLNAEDLGKVDGVYDRAALVAMPPDMRSKYVSHLLNISHCARQFLICYDYDEGLLKGPPFSVKPTEVDARYAAHFSVTSLYREKVDGGFRQQSEVYEAIYLLEALD